jgi:hypothetical protein
MRHEADRANIEATSVPQWAMTGFVSTVAGFIGASVTTRHEHVGRAENQATFSATVPAKEETKRHGVNFSPARVPGVKLSALMKIPC